MQHPSLYAEIKCQSRWCAAPLWHSKKSVETKTTHINMQWMRREWFDCSCHLKCATTVSMGSHWKWMGKAALLLQCHIWCAPSLRMCAKSTHITATFSTTTTLLLLQGLCVTNSSPQIKSNNSMTEWQGTREHKVHPIEMCSLLKCWFIAYKMSEVCHHPSILTVCHVQRLDGGSQDIKPTISAAYHVLKQIWNKYTLIYKA